MPDNEKPRTIKIYSGSNNIKDWKNCTELNYDFMRGILTFRTTNVKGEISISLACHFIVYEE